MQRFDVCSSACRRVFTPYQFLWTRNFNIMFKTHEIQHSITDKESLSYNVSEYFISYTKAVFWLAEQCHMQTPYFHEVVKSRWYLYGTLLFSDLLLSNTVSQFINFAGALERYSKRYHCYRVSSLHYTCIWNIKIGINAYGAGQDSNLSFQYGVN